MEETISGLLDQAVSPLSRSGAVFVAAGAALVTAGTLHARQLLTVGVGPLAIGPVPAVIALAGLLFGPVAVVGSIVGYLGDQALQGFFPLWAAAGYLALGLLVRFFWGSLGTRANLTRPQLTSVSQLWTFVLAATLASLSAATLVAWGYEITGRFPFFPTVLSDGLARTLSVVIGGGVGLAVAPRLLGKDRWQSAVQPFDSRRHYRGDHTPSWIALTGVFLFAWVAIGSVTSIGFQIVELVPPFHLRLRGLDPLVLFKASGPFSGGGTTLQLGLGVTVMSLWFFSLRRWNIVGGRDQGGDDD